MKIRGVFAAIVCFLATANMVFGGTIVYEVKAWIDGRDLLVLQGNTVQWEHLTHAAVGRHGGNNYPTTLSAWLDGNQIMDQVQWIPQWPENPPAEIRYEAESDFFTELLPALPEYSDILSVYVVIVEGRDSVQLMESPSETNGGRLVVDLNDITSSGTYWYRVQIFVDYQGIIVPDVVGMLRADAENTITVTGFNVGAITEQYSDTVEIGRVISQTPSGETETVRGWTIDMVISAGKLITVPDLYNIHIDDAANLLYENELTLGTLQTGYNRSIPEHHVISQSPAAGQIVPAGTAINLIFVGGWGWEDDPFHIWTAEQLNSIGQNPDDWGGYFKLMADIDMSAYTGTQYNIIGNDINPFGGVFDGNGHTISNLTYTTTDELVSAGLFGVTGAAVIKDVHLKDVSISAASYAGALIGHQSDGQVLRCSSTGTVAASNFSAVYVGGLIGKADWGGNVTDCSSSCTVTASADAGASCAGGLVGLHHGGFISRSFATGSVSASGDAQSMAGGIAGSVEYGGSVKFCYATGSVSAASDENGALAGGVAGYVNEGVFTDNYSTGAVTSTSIADSAIAGGLVGMRDWGNAERCFSTGTVTSNGAVESIAGGLAGIGEDFIACFWDTDTSNQSESAGGEDVFGKTTAEMKTQATFTNNGWDFANEISNGTDDIWRMCTDGTDYPKFDWESIEGDFACPDGVNSEDMILFFQHWLFIDCTADNNFCGGADMNASGTVDMADFAIFAENWLEGI